MAEKHLKEAFVDQMRDVLSAEQQIIKALRQMEKKATHADLQTAFQNHLKETEQQIERLERAFELLELKPRSSRCEAMGGILEEGKEIMQENATPEAKDAMMIAAAQKVEHYEIATYGTLCTWANTLGYSEIAELLGETLEEEKRTDEKLTQLAGQLNEEALAQ